MKRKAFKVSIESRRGLKYPPEWRNLKRELNVVLTRLRPTRSKIFTCYVCSKKYNNIEGLNRHKESHTNVSSDEVNEETSSDEIYEIEYVKHDKPELITDLTSKTVINDFQAIQCATCNYYFNSMYMLKFHIQKFCQYYCKPCDIYYRIKDSLFIHVATKHKYPRFFKCILCETFFDDYTELQNHLIVLHGYTKDSEEIQIPEYLNRFLNDYFCYVCRSRFNTIAELNKHKRLHKTANNVAPVLVDPCSITISDDDNENIKTKYSTKRKYVPIRPKNVKLFSQCDIGRCTQNETREKDYATDVPICRILRKPFKTQLVKNSTKSNAVTYPCNNIQKPDILNNVLILNANLSGEVSQNNNINTNVTKNVFDVKSSVSTPYIDPNNPNINDELTREKYLNNDIIKPHVLTNILDIEATQSTPENNTNVRNKSLNDSISKLIEEKYQNNDNINVNLLKNKLYLKSKVSRRKNNCNLIDKSLNQFIRRLPAETDQSQNVKLNDVKHALDCKLNMLSTPKKYSNENKKILVKLNASDPKQNHNLNKKSLNKSTASISKPKIHFRFLKKSVSILNEPTSPSVVLNNKSTIPSDSGSSRFRSTTKFRKQTTNCTTTSATTVTTTKLFTPSKFFSNKSPPSISKQNTTSTNNNESSLNKSTPHVSRTEAETNVISYNKPLILNSTFGKIFENSVVSFKPSSSSHSTVIAQNQVSNKSIPKISVRRDLMEQSTVSKFAKERTILSNFLVQKLSKPRSVNDITISSSTNDNVVRRIAPVNFQSISQRPILKITPKLVKIQETIVESIAGKAGNTAVCDNFKAQTTSGKLTSSSSSLTLPVRTSDLQLTSNQSTTRNMIVPSQVMQTNENVIYIVNQQTPLLATELKQPIYFVGDKITTSLSEDSSFLDQISDLRQGGFSSQQMGVIPTQTVTLVPPVMDSIPSTNQVSLVSTATDTNKLPATDTGQLKKSSRTERKKGLKIKEVSNK